MSGSGLGEPYRVALYYAPEADDPLWQAGVRWLGRDPETGQAIPQPAELQGFPADLTNEAAGYGLHATLKAPFRLAEGCGGYAAFRTAAEALAQACRPFWLPALALRSLGGFLTLCEAERAASLQALADLAVAAMDRFRAPLSAEERARRLRHGLSGAEEAMLGLWGYPHVFQLFRFHITLSRRLSAAEEVALRPLAERHFGPLLGAHARQVRSLAIFTQAAKGSAFLLRERLPFGAEALADDHEN